MMNNKISNLMNQNGLIGFITLFSVSVIALAVASSLVLLVNRELKISRSGGALDETFYAAEAGLNESLYRLISYPGPKQYNFTLNGIEIVAKISSNPANPYQRLLESTATSPDGKIRTVSITANTSSYAGGFDYAVQGGAGGVFLDNNSKIVGDVYSNGSILPGNGGATGKVQGSAWAALDNKIERVNIDGNAYANRIEKSNISGQAYYQSIDNDSEVSGSNCPNTNCHPGLADPAIKDFPLKVSDIDKWKSEINSSVIPVATSTPSICPPEHPTGFYCVVESITLGNQKIDSDFYVGKGATLILNGNLWVTGDIILDNNGNNGTIKIDSSLGAASVVMISDGIINVGNNYLIEGTGNPASFILMLSMSPSLTNTKSNPPAIFAGNNSTAVIYAALAGMLYMKNNNKDIAINAAVAEKLHLAENVKVTFNPMISAFYIPNGGDSEVGTAIGTWREK